MAFVFERIALYLNLVTRILNDPRNHGADGRVSLKFLTGNDNLRILAGAGAFPPVETQVLAINHGGAAFWIANNEPCDTVTQGNFLAALKIDSFAKLMNHVDMYQGSVLPTNGGTLNGRQRPGQEPARGRMSLSKDTAEGKDGLLYKMMMDGKEDADYVAPGFLDVNALPATAAAVPVYSLNSPPDRVPPGGLCFITGDYQGEGGNKMHAEQRMLSALSRLPRVGPNRRIDVAGCKAACEGCASALRNASTSLHEVRCELGFINAAADRLRDAARIGERGGVPNLCILDPALFPVTPTAAAAAAPATL